MQFTIRTIFLVMLFLAGSMGTLGPTAGLTLAVYLIGACLTVKYSRHRPCCLSRTIVLFAVVFVPLAILLLLPAHSRARPAAYRAACRNNMKQLGCAIFNHRDSCGAYPPAYVTDADGRLMHGWRSLLTPFQDEPSKAVHFAIPWNSIANKSLFTEDSYAYSCPAGRNARIRGTTDYVAVVGKGTMWSATGLGNVADPANTIMVIEIADSNIPWIEPRDLSLDEVLEPRGSKNRPFANRHGDETHGIFLHPTPGPYHVLTADGYAHELRVIPSRDELTQLFDPGPKSIKISAIAERAPTPRPKWSVIIALVIMLVSYVAICRTRLWPAQEQERYNGTELEPVADQEGHSP